MSYLDLLKKIKKPGVPTLQNHQNPEKVGSVGFVGTSAGAHEKNINAGAATLQNHQNPEKGGSVGFVGTVDGAFEKITAPNTNSPAKEKLNRFAAKGMSEEHAERVVKLLAERDPWDDRRSCGECASYAAGFCLKRLQPIGQCDDIALVLHRCAGFAPNLAATEDERHE